MSHVWPGSFAGNDSRRRVLVPRLGEFVLRPRYFCANPKCVAFALMPIAYSHSLWYLGT